MKTKTAFWWIVGIVALMVVVSAAVYSRLPAVMATHWGANNSPNGTMPRFWGVAFPILLTVGVAALLWIVPYIDPRRRNYEAFRSTYNAFVVGLVVFLAYLDFLMLAWNLGYQVPIGRAIAPAVGLVFVGAGVLVQKAQPNWFVGIRTPWTLSSPTVWEKTHKLAAPFIILGGIVTAFGVFWVPLVWVGIVLLVLALGGVVVYSYFAYEAEQKGKA